MQNNRITLNREYAVRHLGVTALFLAMSLWFVFDGAIAWPNENKAWEKERGITAAEYVAANPKCRNSHLKEERDGLPHLPSDFDRQFQFAVLCAAAAAIIGFGVFRNWRSTLEWDDNAMTGSLTSGRPLAFAEVAVDRAKWEKKGILRVYAKDGRCVTIDTWHHSGAGPLCERLLAMTAQATDAKDEVAEA